ncbi:cell wall protein AWA1-like isoform X2 [Thrips palmi]|uniref:Cell wall protein AWA1-like isoform X2 n=1 Tax=Thrips palmi TaxID=161013 RepID=A0A6P8ZNM8_THRPL|nr:cell wall protein AWA1-like isoform X2 [Thrips palmi]
MYYVLVSRSQIPMRCAEKTRTPTVYPRVDTSAMECQVCFEKFNAVERRPKVLPCGHTYCLQCLKELPRQRCPTDRKIFTELPVNLVDNFQILNVSESVQPTLWCCSCQKEATSKECLDWHSLCSMKKALTDKASPLLDSLQTALEEASLRVEAAAKVRELVLQHSSRVEQAHDKLLKAQATLQSALKTEQGDLAKAVTGVEQALAESAAVKARPSAKDGDIGTLRVDFTQSNEAWSAGLIFKDAMADQFFQGLDMLTEGQLTWQKSNPSLLSFTPPTAPGSSSKKSKTATNSHGSNFAAATASALGSAPVGLSSFGSSSSGLYGAPSSAAGSLFSGSLTSFGSSSTGQFGAPSSAVGSVLTTSLPSLGSNSTGLFGAPSPAACSLFSGSLTSFGSSSNGQFGAPSSAVGSVLTTALPSFGSNSTGVFGASSASGAALTTVPLIGSSSSGLFGAPSPAVGSLLTASIPSFGSSTTGQFGAPSSAVGSVLTSSAPSFVSSSPGQFDASLPQIFFTNR